MDELLKKLEDNPQVKKALEEAKALKGKLDKEDLEELAKKHGIDLPDSLDELKEDAEKLLAGGKEGIADAIKGIGGLFGKK